MDFFPQEIRRQIFFFDPTGREMFQHTLHQMKFCKVLYQLKGIVNWANQARETDQHWSQIYFSDLEIERSQFGLLTDQDREMILEVSWERFCDDLFG